MSGSFVSGVLWGSAATAFAFFLFGSKSGKAKGKIDAVIKKSKRGLRGARKKVAFSRKGEFMSDLVAGLWKHLGVAIGEAIESSVEPMLNDVVKGIRFTKCDLGDVPIKFENIIVHPLENGYLKFDMDIEWDGACEIQLKAKIIKLGVKNVKLAGRMQFIMKPLSDSLPCAGMVQYAFINVPTIDIDFTGLANVADMSGIEKKIHKIVDDVISSVMVLPNRLMFKLDAACDYRDGFVPPIGVAQITAVSGRGFKIQKQLGRKDDIVDVYLNVSLGGKLWKTSVQHNNLTPKWHESADFLLNDIDQVVEVVAWDEDLGPLDSDDYLGSGHIRVADMLRSRKPLEVELLDENENSTGAFVKLGCHFKDLIENSKAIDTEPTENTIGGLLTIIIAQAFNLDLPKKEAASYVQVTYGKEKFLTGVVSDWPGYDCLNPIYDISFLVPITGELSDVVLDLHNGEKVLGSITISSKDLLESNTIKMTKRIGDSGASLAYQVSLSAVEKLTAPALTSDDAKIDVSEAPSEKEEKVKLTVVSGNGFKIIKKKFKKNDIPDVYCKIKFGTSPTIWKTSVIENDVAPKWNETRHFTLLSSNESISVEAWESNRKTEDTKYGSFRVTVGDLLEHNGTAAFELENEGSGIGCFITLSCDVY